MEFINIRNPRPQRQQPTKKNDPLISEIVGKPISTTDPRLMQFLATMKKRNGDEVSLSGLLRHDNTTREALKKALT